MEKTNFGAIGAISSLVFLPATGVGAATLSGPAAAPARSYADLLEPIPNAVERLRLADAQDAHDGAKLIKAQFYHHHHHHHHHHSAYWPYGYYGYYSYPRPYYAYGHPYYYRHPYYGYRHRYYYRRWRDW
jgi:predicted metallo-beta-lactamase superfamily hydrolase